MYQLRFSDAIPMNKKLGKSTTTTFGVTDILQPG